MSDWAAALDAFERRIAEQRDALDLGEAGELEPFVPPARLGPLPPELEERATALLAAATDVEAELAGVLVHLGEDLAVVRKLSASIGRPAGPRFVDTAL
jgi:hypothetical protein